MTVAAIDRRVHQAVILEINIDSYRRKAAITRARDQMQLCMAQTHRSDSLVVSRYEQNMNSLRKCRHADPMLLSADHAIPLGLMINELVTNECGPVGRQLGRSREAPPYPDQWRKDGVEDSCPCFGSSSLAEVDRRAATASNCIRDSEPIASDSFVAIMGGLRGQRN